MAKEMSMTDITPMNEDRLARQMKAETGALKALSKRAAPLNWRNLLGVLASGIAFGMVMFLNYREMGSHWPQLVMFAMAVTGFYSGLMAMLECTRIGKRLDAAIMLLMHQREQRY